MKNFLRNCFLFSILFFSFSQISLAQNISHVDAKEMITNNAASLKLSKIEIENSVVSNAYIDKTSGTQLIYLQQSYQDVPVYNSIQVIVLKSDKVVSLTGSRIKNIEEKVVGNDAKPLVTAKQSVSYAARSLNINTSEFATASLSILNISDNKQKVEFGISSISQENIVSQLLWVPDSATGRIHLAWQVRILPPNSSDSWLVFIDAKKGVELSKLNMTLTCSWDTPEDRKMHESHTSEMSKDIITQSDFKNNLAATSSTYTVIPFGKESPSHSGFVKVTDPWLMAGSNNNAITLGWHNDGATEYNITRGNNVWAKEDVKGNNDNTGVPATSTTPLPNLSFNFPFNADDSPGSTNNLAAGITNLFYWNNLMHDISYQYGFDEVSGNFQNDNLGRGGLGNDFVFADAQDGSGKNNANFSTPPDGNSPRMQMFLWSGTKKTFKVNTPISLQGYKTAKEGGMSTNNLLDKVGPVTGDVILYQDNAAGDSHLGCGAPVNTITGKIALIDRGNCAFAIKVKNAQTAGAKAVIIINNDAANPTEVIGMGGDDNSITIPAVMISLQDGAAIKNQLQNNVTVNVTLAADNNDADLDNGIIAHEYTHGISNRLTGGPAQYTCLSNAEQGGEGWSDYFSLMVTTDWTTATTSDGPKARPVGTYLFEQDPSTGNGIRTYPYSTNMAINPWTYAGVASSGGEVHDIGEIWAVTLWDMTWNIIQLEGINPDLYNANGKGGNSIAMKLVTLGMKLQPCSPGFLDARDAILKADQILYAGKYNCVIWNAFARRGMGVSAQQGSSNSTTDQVEKFDKPSSAVINKSADKIIVAQNDFINYTFTVTTQCEAISNYKIVDTLTANVTYVSGGNYNSASRTVSFDISSLAAAQSATYTFKVKVNANTYFKKDTVYLETVPDNAIPGSLIVTSNKFSKWVPSTENHSPNYSIKSVGSTTSTEQMLSSVNSYLIENYSELSFWQKYNTEINYDGGVVELSTDNGVSWFDAGPYMRLNGYNSTMSTGTNLENKKAFSGVSNGWIQTVISLGAFEGQNFRFRFRFVTDEGIASGGWYIDDILILKKPAAYNIVRLYNGATLASLSDVVTDINNSTAPVTWKMFTAEKNGNTAVLKWSTSQEANSDKFIVERSMDGIHFNEINSLKAAGNSTDVSNYNMTDDSPLPGVNIYRIKQMDLDGNYTYSEIKSVTFDFSLGLISISPNPSKGGVVTLKIAGNQRNIKVALLNSAGQILSRFNVSKDKNDLLLPTLASGVYYLKITGENISTVQKLVIEK
ncbi:MAG: M36 family metallopeptidase [Ginsengibacter sp.]